MEPIAEFVHRGDLLSTAILDSTSAKSRQMSSFSLATRLLLLLITGYSLFTCRKQDDTDEGCVTRALNHLQWPTLESRRKVARLSLLHKTLHGKASVAMPSYVTHKPDLRTRGSHPMKFLTIQSNCDEYKNSFWPRTIREWNKLPPAVLDINNTELFKTKLTM